MITAGVIKQIAVALQTTELNIAREYAQHLFLSGFYQQRGTRKVMFKGGTALRVVYNSPRFSEDLDFSGFGISMRDIEDWIAITIAGIEQSGISVSIEESKKTSGGYLGILYLGFSGYRIRILLEISLRRKNGLKGRGVLIASDLTPAYTVTLLPEEALVREKLSALLDRRKPRDFFDCYFMLRKNLIQPGQRHLLLKVKQVLAESRINFKTELSDFLPRPYKPIVSNFKKALMAELEHYG